MRKKWLAIEETKLTEIYNTASPEELENLFGTTYHAVKLKAHKLGLNKQAIAYTDEEIIAGYLTGIPLTEFLDKFKIGTTTLYRILHRNGVQKRNLDLPEINEADFKNDYTVLDMPSLISKYGISDINIRLLASRLKVTRPKHLFNCSR